MRWTWQAQVSPEIAWSYADLKDAITDVEVIDPHTVRYHFREAYASQLLDAVEGKILPKHIWSRIPFAEWRQKADWFRDNLVTSGPFRLAAWRHGEEVVLERNERYFDPTVPKLDRVVFRVAPDAATHVEQLLTPLLSGHPGAAAGVAVSGRRATSAVSGGRGHRPIMHGHRRADRALAGLPRVVTARRRRV